MSSLMIDSSCLYESTKEKSISFSFFHHYFFKDLFVVLKQYLLSYEYRILMQTSKQEFEKIKKETIDYRLCGNYTRRFYMNDEFRNEVLERISDPCNQISLNMPFMGDLNVKFSWKNVRELTLFNTIMANFEIKLDVSNVHASKISVRDLLVHLPRELPTLKNVSIFDGRVDNFHYLSNLQVLKIQNCRLLTDITPFQNIPDLFLANINNVHDISCLGKQKKLHLGPLLHIKDVNHLGTVKESLTLLDLPLVDDVSGLKNIPNLSLYSCENIKNISCLGNHQSIVISGCHEDLSGLESLVNVPDVTLNSHFIDNFLATSNLRKLTLIECWCHSTYNWKSLSHLESLMIRNSRFFIDFSALKNIPDVSFKYCCNLSNFADIYGNHKSITIIEFDQEGMSFTFNGPVFSNVEKLCIGYAPETINGESLVDVVYLKLIGCKVINLSACAYLSHVSLCSCDIEKIEGLEDVHTVILDDCPYLNDISGLGKNYCVKLHRCEQITDVSSLATVFIVSISECINIKNMFCLENVPFFYTTFHNWNDADIF